MRPDPPTDGVFASLRAADDRVVLHERLGAGRTGEVWRATWTVGAGVRVEVAVKRWRDLGSDDAIAALIAEARRLAGVRHPGLVGVRDVVLLGGRPALITDLVPGRDLSAVLADGPLPPRVALDIVAHLADALDAAFYAVDPDGVPLRLVHRDLKPANVRLTPHGSAVLLDLGVARALGEVDGAAGAAGTPRYQPPELWRGGVAHPTQDVFALGVTLGELVGDAAPAPEIAALIASMTSYRPDQRPTARAVAIAARRAAAHVDGPDLRAWALHHVLAEEATGLPGVPRGVRPAWEATLGMDDGPGVTAVIGTPPSTPRTVEPLTTASVADDAPPRRLPWVAGALVGVVAGAVVVWALEPAVPSAPSPSSPPPEIALPAPAPARVPDAEVRIVEAVVQRPDTPFPAPARLPPPAPSARIVVVELSNSPPLAVMLRAEDGVERLPRDAGPGMWTIVLRDGKGETKALEPFALDAGEAVTLACHALKWTCEVLR